MAWTFGDGFDLYAAPADAINGYWDSGANLGNWSLVAGRFAPGLAITGGTGATLVKSSSVNDAVHHLVLAFRQTAAITGTTLGAYLQLLDGVTGQCAIVFRSDGAILLTSGTAAGTVLATYTGAVPVASTWYAFEIEVNISSTGGYMNVRKNGNTVNDFTSATNLNTRVSANNYANRVTFGQNTSVSQQQLDDLYWRSDAASVPWMGDIRCYTRMPASDQSVQFSRASVPLIVTSTGTTANFTNGTAYYTTFTASCDGTIGSAALSVATGFTGNLKCSLFSNATSQPGAVLGSATPVNNPSAGGNTFTFGTPVAVTKGVQYWIGLDSDTTSGSYNRSLSGSAGFSSATAYAAFPVASPGGGAGNAPAWSLNITPTTNNSLVNEAQQDGTTTYVYDSTPGDADFYGIAAIASTPVSTIAVTTRGFMEKSDAGTRTAAVQLKSGSATVASSTLVLAASGWQWAWRTDTVDPNTSAAWTAAAVNNAQVGPKVIA